jgi:cyanate permease
MTPRIKSMWWSLALNAGAALLNVTLVVRSINNGSWLWIMNAAAVIVSLSMVRWAWNKLKEIKQEEKDRVIDILSGKLDVY